MINGTAGRILSPRVDQPELLWTNRDGEEHVEMLPRHENVSIPLIENFIAAVEGKAELLVPGRVGAYTSRVIDAAYRSAQVHKWVDV
ncbi:MAG: Gfo/Idh/MocA family oxidoreductase [Bacillota bacterium]